MRRDINASNPDRRTLLAAAGAVVGASLTNNADAQTPLPAQTTGAVMHVPEHDLPMPDAASPQARAYLTQLAQHGNTYTSGGEGMDLASMRQRVIDTGRIMDAMLAPAATASRTNVETQDFGGVPVYIATRAEASAAERRKVHFFIHGGGFMFGGGHSAMYRTQAIARAYGGVTIGIDYRMPPEHPFPAAVDDCIIAYHEILQRHPSSPLLVSGESAGGNLAAALMHKARDVGARTPSALFLNTPVTDFVQVSDTRNTNAYADPLLKEGRGGGWFDFYVNGADTQNPYLSPLRGDHAHGFPPTYLRSGTRDVLLSDTVRLHAVLRKAGVDAALYVSEGAPHGGYPPDAPEQIDAEADLTRWLNQHWPS